MSNRTDNLSRESLGPEEEPKSILLIAPQPFFLNRGTPINVRAMAEVLAEARYHVDLLVFPQGEELQIPGVEIHRCRNFLGIKEVAIGPSWRKIVLDFFLLFKSISLVRSKKYSVIHGVEEGGCIAGLLAKWKRLPYVFDMDSSMLRQLAETGFIRSRVLLGIVAKIESYFIRNATAVLTVCEALSEYAREVSSDVSVYQIEDFPSDSATNVLPGLLSSLKEELSCNNRPVLVYTGNFETYQGIDLLLESFAYVCREGSRREGEAPLLVLVGGGALASPKVEHYQGVAERLGIAENLSFVGSRPGEEMGSFMALADVLVSPRLEGENTPLKLYSYMAAAKPIVATRTCAHIQVLDDNSAFLAEASSEDFGRALEAALDQSALGLARSSKIAAQAKELVDTRYSFSSFGKRLRQLYSDVVGPSRSSRVAEEPSSSISLSSNEG